MALPDDFDSGVPRAVTDELVTLYRTANKRLADLVLHPPGGTERAIAFRQARAASLGKQVDQELHRLGEKTRIWTGKAIHQAFRDGQSRALVQARQAGVRPPADPGSGGLAVKGSFSLIDFRSVNVFAQDIVSDLSKARDSMALRTKSLLRQTASIKLSDAEGPGGGGEIALTESTIDRILAGGIIHGAPRETIRNLREELRAVAGERVTIVNKHGQPMDFKVGYYAELVARTKTRQATVIARHERLQEIDCDLVSIIGKVSVNFCTAFLGQVFSLSGNSEKYPAYDSLPGGGPPFHPQCSKSTRPFVEALASDAQLEKADGNERSNGLLGQSGGEAQKQYREDAA